MSTDRGCVPIENWISFVAHLAYDTVSSSGQHFTSCSFDKLPEPNRVCAFDIKLLGVQCTKEERFGYERGRPCIILKVTEPLLSGPSISFTEF